MMFSTDDVRNAYFAYRTEILADAENAAPEAIAVEGYESDDPNQTTALAMLKAGEEILQVARLVIGDRYRKGTAARKLTSNVAPTILVDAGHIAFNEAVRQVTLILDADYITPAEAAEATGAADSTYRNNAAAGKIPGAIKRGKQWLIPRSVVEDL